MRSALIRLSLVCLVLVLLASDSWAGPLSRLRERRSGGCPCAAGGCTPSYAPSPVQSAHPVSVAPSGGCPGGRCPLPVK